MFNTALKIAYEAHRNQLRGESSAPYIVHPYRVSLQFEDFKMKTIAILHDVIEDTDLTIEDLKKKMPPTHLFIYPEIFTVIELLTKGKNEDYIDYIKRLSVDEMAVKIKIADIMDNLTDSNKVSEESYIKYMRALDILIK